MQGNKNHILTPEGEPHIDRTQCPNADRASGRPIATVQHMSYNWVTACNKEIACNVVEGSRVFNQQLHQPCNYPTVKVQSPVYTGHQKGPSSSVLHPGSLYLHVHQMAAIRHGHGQNVVCRDPVTWSSEHFRREGHKT